MTDEQPCIWRRRAEAMPPLINAANGGTGATAMTDLSTLSAATDNNQLGTHLCRMWDAQKAELGSGKWAPTLGRFVSLAEWQKMEEKASGNISDA